MLEKLTKEQSGSLGGRKKWSKIDKKKRSDMMRKVAVARWTAKKNKSLTQS